MANTFINGNVASFVDTTMSAGGSDIPVGSMKSLNWQSSMEPGVIQGNSVFTPGLTSGYFLGSADFEILLSESDDWENALTNFGASGLLQTDFDIQVQYALSDESYVETVNLRGCRIKTHGVSAGNGSDALYMKYELVVRRIERNGRPEAIDATGF